MATDFRLFRLSSPVSTGLLTFTLFCGLNFVSGKNYIQDLTLSSEEKAIFDKFKDLVSSRMPKEYMTKEVYLIRWLRSSYFNIPRAEKLLMDNLKWREDHEMETIHSEDWSDYTRDYKYYLKSRDREGKPTLFSSVGKWDFRKAAISGKSGKFNRYIDKILDEACTMVREYGEKYQNVSQGILILNIDGFNLVQTGCLQCIPLILRIIYSYEAHWPGCADKIILVNLPSIAEPILRLAREALHPLTSRDLYFYGTNKKVWLNALLKDYTLDELPTELGGNKVYDEDYDYLN